MSRRGVALFAAGVGFLVACALLAVLSRPRHQVVARWDAPDGVYHALIIDNSPTFTALLGSVHRWRLYLGRDAETPTYGHFVSLPELPDLYGEDAVNWQKSRVAWTPAGVRFTFWTGHELFVPARAYTNGR
jgi:hypothetical protein